MRKDRRKLPSSITIVISIILSTEIFVALPFDTVPPVRYEYGIIIRQNEETNSATN